jgi:hypothetical protein
MPLIPRKEMNGNVVILCCWGVRNNHEQTWPRYLSCDICHIILRLIYYIKSNSSLLVVFVTSCKIVWTQYRGLDSISWQRFNCYVVNELRFTNTPLYIFLFESLLGSIVNPSVWYKLFGSIVNPSTWYKLLRSIVNPSVWYKLLGSIVNPSVWYKLLGSIINPSVWYKLLRSIVNPSVWYKLLGSIVNPSVWYKLLGSITNPNVWYKLLGSIVNPSVWYKLSYHFEIDILYQIKFITSSGICNKL